MTFQSPLAWLGLAAIAIPILIHLLGRRPARRLPFPTLRFVDATRQIPVRRHRLTDLALLAVRIGIVAAAVTALAQPLFLTSARTRDSAQRIARAIVVDTSASMDRVGADGMPAVDRARRDAESLRTESTSARVAESATPATAIPGVLAWLSRQSGRREIVILSDFQPRALARSDLAAIPDDIGIRLMPIDAKAFPDRPPSSATIELLASAEARAMVDATIRAAEAAGAPAAIRADRPIAIVFPQAPDRAALLKDAPAIDQRWMFDVANTIARDRGVVETSAVATFRTDAKHRLLVFAGNEPGTLAAATLVAATARAADPSPPEAERDTAVRSATELRAWERPPAEVSPSAQEAGVSDGRWFWLAALALLALETVMRRRKSATAREVAHARVA